MGSYKSRQGRAGSGGSSSSANTDGSVRSKSTAPTVMSDGTTAAKRTDPDWIEDGRCQFSNIDNYLSHEEQTQSPRESISTYASTTSSTANLPPEEPALTPGSSPLYEVSDREEIFPRDTLASTPSSFASLFPSSRRLLIRHDDATLDGNMNLRVDTVVHTRGGHQQDVILFHLRMYDLFSRKFSLRRYCRESGREVCHSARKEVRSSSLARGEGKARAVFRRSLGSVLAGLRPGSSRRASDASGGIQRRDSGYESGRHDHPFLNQDDIGGELCHEKSDPVLGDTILMEFSNYAHVELNRRGAGPAKRYEYEYWSTKYQWRRECRREGDLREVSYYLVNMRTGLTIAHLMPEIMTPLEALEEESKGGWVPPCSLWISDASAYERMPDVAE